MSHDMTAQHKPSIRAMSSYREMGEWGDEIKMSGME